MLGVLCEVTRDATGYSGDSSFNVLWCKVMHFAFEFGLTLCASTFPCGNPTIAYDSLNSLGYDFQQCPQFYLFYLPLLLSSMQYASNTDKPECTHMHAAACVYDAYL